MFILATAAGCVGNIELIQILYKIFEPNPDCNRDDPAKDPKCGCEFDKCILVLVRTGHGFNHTVAKGVHFCKDCLCKLFDLKKDGTHTPHPLAKYEEFSPDK